MNYLFNILAVLRTDTIWWWKIFTSECWKFSIDKLLIGLGIFHVLNSCRNWNNPDIVVWCYFCQELFVTLISVNKLSIFQLGVSTFQLDQKKSYRKFPSPPAPSTATILAWKSQWVNTLKKNSYLLSEMSNFDFNFWFWLA